MISYLKIGNSQLSLVSPSGLQKTSSSDVQGLRRLLKSARKQGLVFVSVVPALTRELYKIAKKNRICLREIEISDFEMKLPYKKNLGIDRVLNVFSAQGLTKKSFVVVDIGTAMTIEFCDSKKGYLGGWIAAGPKPLSIALTLAGAKLQNLKLSSKTQSSMPKNSSQSLNAGVQNQILGLIEYAKIEALRRWGSRFDLILTGGWSTILWPRLRGEKILLRPNLWFSGMKQLNLD